MVMAQVQEMKQSINEKLKGISVQMAEYEEEITKLRTRKSNLLANGNGERALEVQQEIDKLQAFINAFDGDIEAVMAEKADIDSLIKKEIEKYVKERKEIFETYKAKAKDQEVVRRKFVQGLESMLEDYEKINRLNHYLSHVTKELSESEREQFKHIESGYDPHQTVPYIRNLLVKNVGGVN